MNSRDVAKLANIIFFSITVFAADFNQYKAAAIFAFITVWHALFTYPDPKP